ncbi:unnamed protein product [Phytomonas sp. Hart1]|nr:unnamed protein product [Phytomonas sp. Hart1]|eukprot:CCW70138.1 unnamed protein product [Phytomonas sp. isolate Hart1]
MSSELIDKYTFKNDYVNPRGIPRVAFIDNTAELVKSSGDSVETLLKRLREQYSKYKLAEHRLIRTVANLESKVPDIQKTLKTIAFLKDRLDVEESSPAAHPPQGDPNEGFYTNYGLTESVFCQAHVPPQRTVHLWLGANVMVEYSFDEARELLERNLKSARENLRKTQEDLTWLQEQQTTLEVNTSRVYNYDVVQRRTKEKNGVAK